MLKFKIGVLVGYKVCKSISEEFKRDLNGLKIRRNPFGFVLTTKFAIAL